MALILTKLKECIYSAVVKPRLAPVVVRILFGNPLVLINHASKLPGYGSMSFRVSNNNTEWPWNWYQWANRIWRFGSLSSDDGENSWYFFICLLDNDWRIWSDINAVWNFLDYGVFLKSTKLESILIKLMTKTIGREDAIWKGNESKPMNLTKELRLKISARKIFDFDE